MEIKFYFCDHCKNVAIKVVDHKVPLFCCGEKMTELVPGTVDAAVEKHLPEYTVKNGIVSVHVGFVEYLCLFGGDACIHQPVGIL